MKGKLITLTCAALLALLALAKAASAHFGVVLPSDDIVEQGESRTLTIDVKFIHPFEGQYMNMEKPEEFGVVIRGKKINLTDRLQKTFQKGMKTWKLRYKIKRPGTYAFYVKPAPYFEPSENKFIVHYTKVYVNAFGLEEGWDEPVGLKVEIIPLVRPFGLWTGNMFRGVVLVNGKPAPGIDVEVEYLAEGRIKPPAGPFVTQVVKTDENGIFSYSMPKAGWWGFAALTEDNRKIEKDGKKYPVEIGGVIWVKTVDMK